MTNTHRHVLVRRAATEAAGACILLIPHGTVGS
jgi:hypothetical protein